MAEGDSYHNPSDDPKYQSGESPRPDGLSPDIIVSPDTLRDNRVPPGQSRTRKWPVLHASAVPHIPRDKWRLQIRGLVKDPIVWDWDQFAELPRVKVFADFHCVTRWSRLGNVWEGVSIHTVMERAGVLPEAKFVSVTGFDYGWTTNMPLEEFAVDDALLADTHDGEPLSADHGGPCRLIVPRLYAWKSAKWVKAIDFLKEDSPGYWENAGYHNHGDPWTEERFSYPSA